MSYRALCEALLHGKPYLGPVLRAMQGPPERHRYFRPIVKLAAELLESPLTILEIGSWAGASAISWGTALRDLKVDGHITCVDPWLPYFDTQIDALPVYQEMNRAAESQLIYRLFQHNIAAAGLRDIIHVQRGSSEKVLPQLRDHDYAIVYIDGSHLYKDVLFDMAEAKRLLRDGGILCGDDLELESTQIDAAELTAALQNGQDFLFSAKAGRHYHPGVTAAVGEVIGAVSVWEGFWAIRFCQGRWEQITLPVQSVALPSHIAAFIRRIEGQIAGYRLFSEEGRFFAVSNDVPSEFVDECPVFHDFAPLIFVGSTLQEVIQKITEGMKKAAPDIFPQPRIIGRHRGFNIVKLKDSVYGLRQSIGEVDLSLGEHALLERYSEQDLVAGTSVDGIKARIDCVELSRDFHHVAQNIKDEIEALRNCARKPDWLDEVRASLQHQSVLLQQAVDQAERVGREYTMETAVNLKAEFSREIVHDREQTQKLVHGLERTQAKIEQIGDSSARALASLEEQIKRLGMRGLWRKWFSSNTGR